VLVAAAVTGAWVLASRPHGLAVTGTGADPAAAPATRSAAADARAPLATSGAASAAASAPAAALVVDVAGKVRRPGLYRLPAGSRIYDAVRAAGGALPGVDLTSLNLAAKITDGQQIAVGASGAGAAGGSGGAPGTAGSAAASGPVDLNTATLEQLETLPGVGPVLGQHILDWRAGHGSFATVDQLREVSGIGDVKFAALRSQVTV
jgi:competence protein ComEA